ncbi:sulfatase-like hydrolase/transferase [Rhodohalobacter sulfatireducens]|uniref:Sulfatase-like hydrolase/transferase n=1 Tax=Rhodohalobacter sulfatireducens TaxID=2911366 RepID=A0ABS9KJA1_9BACT|nr:sulfatase-like hydrolase/transferase [Rhodohalobacter sulfatireducens]MCG2590930.1 sulfatase-like hydrolase/transferase [Rhodohalobacter sulfatireducens]
MNKAARLFFTGKYFRAGVASLGILLLWGYEVKLFSQQSDEEKRPNVIVIYTDDHRWDALGKSGNDIIKTPNLDKLVESGHYFPNSFVTLSICTPSRAAFLTGQYGSRNDVMSQSLNTINPDIKTVAQYFLEEDYSTSVFGKWHVSNSPKSMGFEYEFYFQGLAPYWDVPVVKNGKELETSGFVEDVIVDNAIEYLMESKTNEQPFFMWLNTWAPHMDIDFSWPAKGKTLSRYPIESMEIPNNWSADYSGKPPYIQLNRPHQRALYYGYSKAYPLKHHIRGYYAATTDMDAALGKLFDALTEMGLTEDTYILLMGDNGWFMGEHGLTSKVLAYEESIRVPLIVAGPEVQTGVSDHLILNIDLMPTALDLASIEVPPNLHGRSFKHLLGFETDEGEKWREYIFYEAPVPVHGSKPHYAVRTKDWKLIQTYDENKSGELIFEELYHLKNDSEEKINLVGDESYKDTYNYLKAIIEEKIEWSKKSISN